MTRTQIVKLFERNYRVFQTQADGLSHEDSLLRLPVRGGSFNWMMGHIVAARSSFMIALAIDPIWSREECVPYDPGAAPIDDGTQACRLEKILADLDSAQAALRTYLDQLTDADLAAAHEDTTLGQMLLDFAWQEAYYAGQTEILRQLVGSHDQVIR
ncbi:MAG: DinB family protein [Chloroflexi bacterium]|nr:DinB family protein [Chloroflexota bacterium]